MEEKYRFLKKYVIKTSDNLISSISNDIDTARNQIIKTHRTAVLLSMVDTDFNKFPSFAQNKNKLEKFIIDPDEAMPPRISPQLIQQSSHLLAFIHARISDLLDCMLAVKDQEEFYTLVHSAIPSCFGFFSSPEHLQLAFSFYLRVLSAAPKNKRSIILYPFFDSPVIFRFVESVFQPFFERLMRDKRYEKDRSKRSEIIGFYASDLASLIKSSSVLLHSCHAVIMKFMRQQWPQSEVCGFIIDKWLRSQALKWLAASGHLSKKPVLDEVFNTILKKKELYNVILDAVCDANSQFELPDMYTTFDQQYLVFYSSFYDLSLLAKTISTKCTLSPAMSIFFNENPSKYYMFWFKIFPKRPMPHPSPQRPMVFHYEEESIEENPEFERIWRKIENAAEEAEIEPYDFLQKPEIKHFIPSFGEGFMNYAFALSINQLITSADNFEKLLKYKLSYSMINGWLSIATIYNEKLLRSYATYVVLPEISNTKQEINVFREASSLFKIDYIKQSIFFSILEKKLPAILKPHKKAFDELNNMWSTALLSGGLESSTDIGLKSRVASQMFYDASERLLDIDMESLMTSFCTILNIINMFDEAAKFDGITTDLFSAALFLNPSPILPQLYIIINELAMKNPSFAELLTDSQQKSWVSFEGTFLKTAVKNQKIFSTILILKQNIYCSVN